MADPILRSDAINKARKILREFYLFRGTPQEREELLVAANLRRIAGSINLNGPTDVVADRLLNELNIHGFLAEQPAYHALGRLFIYFLDQGSLGRDDNEIIAELIVQYGLIRDPVYIENLRTRFNLRINPPAKLDDNYRAAPVSVGLFPEIPGFETKLDDAAKVELEQVINSEANFLDLHVLQGALYCSRAVARIERPEGTPRGTGFLIAPDLLLTNRHVLPDVNFVEGAIARFGYINDMSNIAERGRVFDLTPGLYESSPEDKLDYALVRLSGKPLEAISYSGKPGDKSIEELIEENQHLGYLLINSQAIMSGSRVNIIQHPNGTALKVVLTQNYVTGSSNDTHVHYIADTDHGSSGSPVFNERWEVVALHHGHIEIELIGVGGKKRTTIENQGIAMKAIRADFKTKNLLDLLPQFR